MEFSADGKITDEENRHLEGHVERSRQILDKLIPRIPLDWVAMLVRTGIAIILFILLIAPPYAYLRAQFLAPVGVSQSSATGTVSVRNYIPEIPVSESTAFWMKRDTNGPIELMHSTDFRGMTAGIVPADMDGDEGVALFWTEPEGNKQALRKLVTDAFFREARTTSSTVWDDQDFTSANVMSTGSRVLVAAGYAAGEKGKVALQFFDLKGKALTPRVDLVMETGESMEDIRVMPWGDAWSLITRIPKGPDSELFDATKIKIRVLDDKLAVTDTVELGVTGYEIGEFPLVIPERSGYAVIATGHPSIRSQAQVTGDRLFAFQFSASQSLTRVLRLTNTGGQHDFGPTGYAMAPGGDYAVGVQNIPGASFEDPKVNYPSGSGRSYIRLFDPSFQIAGALIIYDDPALSDSPDRRGVSHLRQAMIGDRMYSAFDMISPARSETGKPDRSVQAMWMSLTKQ